MEWGKRISLGQNTVHKGPAAKQSISGSSDFMLYHKYQSLYIFLQLSPIHAYSEVGMRKQAFLFSLTFSFFPIFSPALHISTSVCVAFQSLYENSPVF